MNAERLTRLLEPVVSQVGLELDRVDVVPAGRRRLVRVTIDGDGPDGLYPPHPAAPLSTQHRAPGAVHPQSGRGAEVWRDL